MDGSGQLTSDELRLAMRVIGDSMTHDEVEEVVRMADATGDGEIDLNEFVRFFMGTGAETDAE